MNALKHVKHKPVRNRPKCVFEVKEGGHSGVTYLVGLIKDALESKYVLVGPRANPEEPFLDGRVNQMVVEEEGLQTYG